MHVMCGEYNCISIITVSYSLSHENPFFEGNEELNMFQVEQVCN